MATLASLNRQYRDRGVRVVGVSVDDGSDVRVQRFVEDHHVDFPIVHDPAHAVETLYDLVGVPTTFVIGRDGRLVWRYTGNVQDALADAERAINSTLTAQQTSDAMHLRETTSRRLRPTIATGTTG